jgi:hypothetical protein
MTMQTIMALVILIVRNFEYFVERGLFALLLQPILELFILEPPSITCIYFRRKRKMNNETETKMTKDYYKELLYVGSIPIPSFLA